VDPQYIYRVQLREDSYVESYIVFEQYFADSQKAKLCRKHLREAIKGSDEYTVEYKEIPLTQDYSRPVLVFQLYGDLAEEEKLTPDNIQGIRSLDNRARQTYSIEQDGCETIFVGDFIGYTIPDAIKWAARKIEEDRAKSLLETGA
jgi:hypothetical protein